MHTEEQKPMIPQYAHEFRFETDFEGMRITGARIIASVPAIKNGKAMLFPYEPPPVCQIPYMHIYRIHPDADHGFTIWRNHVAADLYRKAYGFDSIRLILHLCTLEMYQGKAADVIEDCPPELKEADCSASIILDPKDFRTFVRDHIDLIGTPENSPAEVVIVDETEL